MESNYRRVSPLEGMFLHAPYAIVTLVARIKGEVTEEMLRGAVTKAQKRHTNLRMRIDIDQEGLPWFSGTDVGEIPIKVFPRESEDSWIQILDEENRLPFDFQRRPAIRFLLVQSPDRSDLVIFCHHLICDGLSLAYLARDLLSYLGNPTLEVEVLPDPSPIDKDHLPDGTSLKPVLNYFVERINKKWREERIFFSQEDYQALTEAYWENFQPRMELIEFSEEQTSQLVQRCKEEEVTVNSALAIALISAQKEIKGSHPSHSQITVAGNLRDRIKQPVGEAMGFYAGAVNLKYKVDGKHSFWENARKLNSKIQPLYTNQHLFKDPLIWCYLEPGILEALSFKMVGSLVDPGSPSYEKLSGFSVRKDVISSMIQRQKMDSFDNILIGTAITNLTRMDFPREYGGLELDGLILKPGGAYPLVFVNLLAGVVTCSGKLSMVLEFDERRMDQESVNRIKARTAQILLES